MGFQLCGRSAVCGLCRASILAGLALMQGPASVYDYDVRTRELTLLRRTPVLGDFDVESPT